MHVKILKIQVITIRARKLIEIYIKKEAFKLNLLDFENLAPDFLMKLGLEFSKSNYFGLKVKIENWYYRTF